MFHKSGLASNAEIYFVDSGRIYSKRAIYFSRQNFRRQKGFLIPLALFIVVVLGLLAVTIAKLASSSQNIALREDISAQAFFAAESGANIGLYKLYLSASTRAQVTANCSSLSGANQAFAVTGLQGCSVQWTCAVTTDAANSKSFYRLTNLATCGSGNLSAQRSVVVSAVMQ